MNNSQLFRLILVFIGLSRITANSKQFDFLGITKEMMQRLDKPTSKAFDIDVWYALQTLNATIFNFIDYQQSSGLIESREEMINSRIGLFLFTRFCGPGGKLLNKFFKTDERTYTQIDACCRFHDECPEYVSSYGDYQNYPGLEHRRQFFSRLKCSCDEEFYQCLEGINATFANSVGVGYGLFQRYCFEYQHPIVKCTQYYYGYGLRRCMIYEINHDAPKSWQWFDVLPPYLEIRPFPQFVQTALDIL